MYFLFCLYLIKLYDSCTSITFSSTASSTHFPITSHSADCWDCDNRVALVPSREYLPKSQPHHPIYGLGHLYPRQLSTSYSRSDLYTKYKDNVLSSIEPLAWIDAHNKTTYALWESLYGLVNSEGLGIGESSCAAHSSFHNGGVDLIDEETGKYNQTCLLSIAALTQLGLERCATSQCAIKTMGELAEKYCFYGESFSGGESLSIIDSKTREAWIFHIVPSKEFGAIWAAQRIPEGHMTVVANAFIIHNIDFNDDDNFIYSKNIVKGAIRHGRWNSKDTIVDKNGVLIPRGSFSFVDVFGNNDHAPYMSVRQWSIQSYFSKDGHMPYKSNPFDLPFSVPVKSSFSVSPESVMNVFRWSFENSQFDLSQGVLSGVFNSPYRLERGDGLAKFPKGIMTRGISIPRTSYTTVIAPIGESSLHKGNGVLFYAIDAPLTGVFVPFQISDLKKAPVSKTGFLTKEEPPKYLDLYTTSYQYGHHQSYNSTSAFWSFDIVGNFMGLNFKNQSVEYVFPLIHKVQSAILKRISQIEGISSLHSPKDSYGEFITSNLAFKNLKENALIFNDPILNINNLIRDILQSSNAIEMSDFIVNFWHSQLKPTLFVRYNDGYFNFYRTGIVDFIGYPYDFLKDIQYGPDSFWPHYVKIDNKKCIDIHGNSHIVSDSNDSICAIQDNGKNAENNKLIEVTPISASPSIDVGTPIYSIYFTFMLVLIFGIMLGRWSKSATGIVNTTTDDCYIKV